jgi:SRSO17 transposase
MGTAERFDGYVDHLAQGLGHADRRAGLQGCCTGLMLPPSRKSVEPMAARVDPLHAGAKHQAPHHFIAQAGWPDQELLRRVFSSLAYIWLVPITCPLAALGLK